MQLTLRDEQELLFSDYFSRNDQGGRSAADIVFADFRAIQTVAE